MKYQLYTQSVYDVVKSQSIVLGMGGVYEPKISLLKNIPRIQNIILSVKITAGI